MEKVYEHLDTIYTELRPSSVHGVGYFAVRDIDKGIEIFKPWDSRTGYYSVELYNSKIRLEVRTLLLKYFPKLDDRVEVLLIEGLNFTTPWRHYVNHGLYPNISLTGMALQSIKKGSELVRNYYIKEEQSKINII